MANDKDKAQQTLQALVDNFIAQKAVYTSPEYNESQMRQDFLDKFFLALGWDMDNSREKCLETERSVKLEHSLKINGIKKKPDYTFTIKGKNQFFVEAKKPSVPIKYNRDTAKQIIEYGWNGSTPISILTNFEHLIIYKCAKPWRESENFTKKQIKVIHYLDYIKEFNFIWDTFAHENVLNGSINKLIKNNISPKETEPVNKAFLESLNEWRDELATNIAQRNKDLEEEAINTAVQLTIDRIVFLRVCEDREVETAEQLLKVAKSKGNTYQNLFEIFKIADQKYNSGIFDLKKDTLTAHLIIDNKVIKNILLDFYEKEANFNFALIPIEILGYAYEQFLGKVIRLEKTGKAIVEEKPEVRKAGGVYYTPEYIVQYIVENTVGKLIADKTPEEVSKIKVLDPSCGSGSFLIGAYQYLLDWHLHYYLSNPSYLKTQKDNPLTSSHLLTSKEKKRILLNNIYGVDIDMQAVEVTKLSLLLKALEGETAVSIQTSLQIFKERVLPTIDGNVQSGNSLISPDFYDAELFLTPKEERKINVFDWEFAFPTVFKQGGFDCVIGNPPYVLLQMLEIKEIFNYASRKYQSAHYKIDTYQLFIENSIKLLKNEGYLAYITPNTFLKNIHAEPLRKFILDNTVLKELLLFYYNVFEQASVDVCVSLVKREKPNGKNLILIKEVREEFKPILKREIEQNTFYDNKRLAFNVSADESEIIVIAKAMLKAKPLSYFCGAYFGIQTWDRKKYVSSDKVNNDYKPVIDGVNIQPYFLKSPKEYVCFTPEAIKSGGNEKIYTQDRLCTRQIGNIPHFAYIEANIFTLNTVYNIYKTQDIVDLKFILGIINSNFISYYWKKINSDEKVTFPKVKKESLLNIPIPNIDFNNKNEKNRYDTIIKYVNDMLNLKQRQQEGEQKLEARIHHRDKQINELVYQLYDLTEEEIKIIELNYE